MFDTRSIFGKCVDADYSLLYGMKQVGFSCQCGSHGGAGAYMCGLVITGDGLYNTVDHTHTQLRSQSVGELMENYQQFVPR